MDDIFGKVIELTKNKMTNLTEGIKSIITDPLDFILGDSKLYIMIFGGIILIIVVIGTIIYFYPWIRPFLNIRRKTKGKFESEEKDLEGIELKTMKKRAPSPPILYGKKRKAPSPPKDRTKENTLVTRPKGYKLRKMVPLPTIKEIPEINEISAIIPSAPPEREYKDFVHILVPKIYQISILETHEGDQPYLMIEANGHKVKALLDTGASIIYCRNSIARKIGRFQFDLDQPTKAKVANGDLFYMIGKVLINFRIKETELCMNVSVSEDKNCPVDLLLGTDFMKMLSNNGFEISFDWKNKIIKLNHIFEEIQNIIPMIANLEEIRDDKIYSKEKVIINPHSDNIVLAEKKGINKTNKSILICQGNTEVGECLMVGKTICNKENIVVRILNVGNAKITIYPGQKIAQWEYIEEETEKIFEININPREEKEEEISPEIDITAKLPTPHPEPQLLLNLNLEDSCFSEIAKRELEKIIEKYSEVFVDSEGNIGHFLGPIKHRIDLIDQNKIVQQRPYRVPLQLREEMHKQIHDLLRQNIIRESNSPFSSPVVLVKKKDGKYRFAIDYRQLNQNTKKACYFLPLIQDILDEIGGKSIFSSFDFMSGFFQIGIVEEHIERTAFATFCGIYEFLRMPMGLCGAPCTFQKAMEYIRKELGNGILCYLDDLIISSIDEKTHLEDIENLLRVLKKYNLKLRLDKCKFGHDEIKYLGFLISRQGIRPDPKNVAAVQRFEIPKTLNQLRSFIGCVSYFRRFIKNFAIIMAPLNELTKSQENIGKIWTENHQKAFEEIKKKLWSTPVLASPKFNEPFIIETDASKIAIAGCLLQKGNDGEHPIGYISRKLKPAEQKYITAELEALAIVYTLNQFRPYIEGNHVTIVRTDNTVACSLLKKRDLVGRMAKYQIAIQEFNIKIEHRTGKSNKFCDYMSRYPGKEYNMGQIVQISEEISEVQQRIELPKVPELDQQDFELPKDFYYPIEKLEVVTLKEIKEELKKDKGYQEIIDILKDENIPDEKEEQKEFLDKVEKIHEKYSLIDEILYKWVEKSSPVIVIPFALRERIIRECHEDVLLGAHLGIVKTLEKIRKRFYWKNLIRDTKKHINSCIKCQQRKSHPRDLYKEPLRPIPIPEGPMERVHIDLLGPLPINTEGYRYIFAITDAFSKWLTVIPLINQSATEVVQAFENYFLTKYGTPRFIVSDNGKQFTSKMFEDLSKIYCFKHRKTTTYRPQANGAVERTNRIVADMLANYINSKGNDWPDFLQLVCFAYNTSIHASTNQTPFYILFLRDPILPIDLRMEREENIIEKNPKDISEYVQEYTQKLRDVKTIVSEIMIKAQHSQKKYADLGRNAKEHEFKVGELVMIQIDHWSGEAYHKFRAKWNGPWRIIDVIGPILTIKNLADTQKTIKINVEKVKKFRQKFEENPNRNELNETDQ